VCYAFSTNVCNDIGSIFLGFDVKELTFLKIGKIGKIGMNS
jgi:hypothetical protein